MKDCSPCFDLTRTKIKQKTRQRKRDLRFLMENPSPLAEQVLVRLAKNRGDSVSTRRTPHLKNCRDSVSTRLTLFENDTQKRVGSAWRAFHNVNMRRHSWLIGSGAVLRPPGASPSRSWYCCRSLWHVLVYNFFLGVCLRVTCELTSVPESPAS